MSDFFKKLTWLPILLFLDLWLLTTMVTVEADMMPTTMEMRLTYPNARRDDTTVDEHYGKKVPDPYRWLENVTSEETEIFLKGQKNLTDSFLKAIPQREAIRERLTQVWNYPKFTAPQKAGTKYFHFENSGLQEHDILYVQDELDGPSKIFVDPNKFPKDVSLGIHAFSWDGSLFAYSQLKKGGDWQVLRFKNVSNGIDLDDELVDVKYASPQWSKDGQGVFYVGYPKGSSNRPAPESTTNNRILYHRLGTKQETDILVADFPNSPRLLSPKVSRCGKYLILSGYLNFNSNTIHILSIDGGVDTWSKNIHLVPIFTAADHRYSYVSNEGSTFLFRTSHGAPNFRLITVTLDLQYHDDGHQGTEMGSKSKEEKLEPAISLLSTFLPEHPKNIISWAFPVGKDKLVVCYTEDVKHTLELRSLKDGGLIQKFELEVGTISNIYTDGGNQAPLWGPPEDHTEIFFSIKNFLTPGTTYKCSVEGTPECKVLRQVNLPSSLDVSKFVTEQVFYPSKDGTIVPMYIVRKKTTKLDGTAPTVLYGYGGFNVPILPYFSTTNLVLMEELGGIYAIANIRGGGEYGPKWHKDGSVLNKKNSFDDFIAAAEYLIQKNYTSASKLAITGASNGGYLIGACVNLRPDLFAAAIPDVGVLDLISDFAEGFVGCKEYGCSKDKDQFENNLRLSPLQNIKIPANDSVQYPAILVMTADHDDRVPPSQSYKYVAELQHTIGQNLRQTNPLLLRVETDIGHGFGAPVSKQIAKTTDFCAFMAKTLKLNFHKTDA